jgi:hypothetical protein
MPRVIPSGWKPSGSGTVFGKLCAIAAFQAAKDMTRVSTRQALAVKHFFTSFSVFISSSFI